MRCIVPALFATVIALPAADVSAVDLRLLIGTGSADQANDLSGTSGGQIVSAKSSDSTDGSLQFGALALGHVRLDVNHRYEALFGLGFAIDGWRNDRVGGEDRLRHVAASLHGGFAYALNPQFQLEALAHAGVGRLRVDGAGSAQLSGTAFNYGLHAGATYAIDAGPQKFLIGGYAGYDFISAEVSGSGGSGATAYDLTQHVDVQGPVIGLTLGLRF